LTDLKHSRFTVASFLALNNGAFSSTLCNGLYPNLSQCVELRAQTAQSQPNVIYTYQCFRREPSRNHPSRRPLWRSVGRYV